MNARQMKKYIKKYGTIREECENNLAQMPEEEFDMLIEKFGLPADGVKL